MIFRANIIADAGSGYIDEITSSGKLDYKAVTGEKIRVGNKTGHRYRGFLSFDLSGVHPAASVISAVLVLHGIKPGEKPADFSINWLGSPWLDSLTRNKSAKFREASQADFMHMSHTGDDPIAPGTLVEFGLNLRGLGLDRRQLGMVYRCAIASSDELMGWLPEDDKGEHYFVFAGPNDPDTAVRPRLCVSYDVPAHLLR